ncbi:hypothetical protein BDR03DRAFT_824255, partial [Suillus americanus]
DGLLHHPYLDTINIIMDPDLQALCCYICQVAMPPDHISGHVKQKHPAVKLDSTQYCQAVADMKVPMTLPTSIAGGRYCHAYKGLLLNRGLHRQFWRVAEVEEISCDYQQVIDRMKKEMAEVTRVEQVPQDKRMRYFESALVLLDTTDELILQRLNSPDPLKEGINNLPLHRHQEDTTMKSYIRTTIGLLAMLLRTESADDYEIPIPHELMHTLQELELALVENEQTTD